ncbi:hypothetical protein A3F29_01895 [Candidatus Roizmanbacteria bacterium RIFCSPHIGHO2_12_FULL_33_9]|uniref:DUF5667 domain-containing protein n=1 Tax=Candidatus Roizmanbacteria bacterium RIFCSPHIGHO2_12_FULL_33_9 TaxID=1802045 RepID=A0A1F7HFH5_9BACT|nr:MAG: hypothetical protein A3F29_01895 [Candidatus Roizmanbacteria bacterium RIFCSPHIGHO2_12_FULL_33_9]
MVKKIFILIFIIFLFLLSSSNSFSQEITSPSADRQSTPSSYQLAYPGILPDHQLYKLKVLRDKLIPLFISSPQKKIEFYLLQTDKGIFATSMLVKKGKIDLAKETGLKAEHNYTILTYIVKSNKWSISDKEYKKLYDAALKHQEVLQSIIKSLPKNQQETFQKIFYFSKQNLNEIKIAQYTLD